MKHIEGNTPKCWECFFYREKTGNDCSLDGWCLNPFQLSHGINGKLREKPKEKEAVRANNFCRQWEDAETRTNYFDVITGRYKEQPEQMSLIKSEEE